MAKKKVEPGRMDVSLPPRRFSITVTDRHLHLVDALGEKGPLRQVLQEWYAQRGEQVDLGSESARLRAMLDVADSVVRSWVLEAGYERMATWHNEQAEAERQVWQRRRDRSAAQWPTEGPAAEPEVAHT